MLLESANCAATLRYIITRCLQIESQLADLIKYGLAPAAHKAIQKNSNRLIQALAVNKLQPRDICSLAELAGNCF
jgi:hypothetical protein